MYAGKQDVHKIVRDTDLSKSLAVASLIGLLRVDRGGNEGKEQMLSNCIIDKVFYFFHLEMYSKEINGTYRGRGGLLNKLWQAFK